MGRVFLAIGLAAAGAGAVYLIITVFGAPRPKPEPPARSLFESPAAAVPAAGEEDHSTRIRFVDGTEASGVHFRHIPDRSEERYMPETMCAGVVLADFNRDGAPDMFCVNSGSLVAPERPAGAVHRLYLNDGKGHFTDATEAWKVPTVGYGMGATAGDYDNDGWIDVLVTTYNAGERLLHNVGGRFVDVTDKAHVTSDGKWSTSAGFFDMDNDGDLDIYVARYINYTLANALRCYAQTIHIYCTPVLYDPVPDRLLINNGDGTFADVSTERGMPTEACKGLGLGIADIDNDGDEDVYLANDTTPNFLLLNDGTGHFHDVGKPSGVAYSETGAEEAGMGADFSDYNDDHYTDIVCTNFQSETTCLYRQGSGLFFREVADVAGVGKTARARLSFGIDFMDADNDGDEDLLMANGHIEDNIGEYRQDVQFAQINTLYENKGGGRLVDVTENAGPALQDRQVSRGLATGDLDGDGDLDYVIANNGGTYQVGVNETPEIGNFVNLWLEGRKANRMAIGARVETTVGGRSIQRQICGASSYLSYCDPRIHIGLGAETSIAQLTIHWPGGKDQTLHDLQAGRFYHVVEGKDPETYVPGQRRIAP